jgi:hypothetical protein
VVLLSALAVPVEAQQGSFTDVVHAPGINTASWESMGSLSGDGGTIYFTSDRDPTNEVSLYRVDLWTGTWNPQSQQFEGLTSEGVLQNVNSDYDECTPYISSNNLVLAFYSDRPTSEGYDVWVATRPDADAAFGVPLNAKGPLAIFSEVNSGCNEFGQSMSPDGLTLYFSSDRTDPDAAGGLSLGGFDLFTATRASTAEPFSAATLRNFGAPVNTEAHEFSPIVSSDALAIFWSDLDIAPFRDGVSANIWMATRPDLASPFGNVVPVPGVNTDAVEFDFFITADWPAAGAKLYFSSDRTGVLDPPELPYRGDVWVATWVPDEPFRRGDARADGQINLTDGVVILNFLFRGAGAPSCLDAADADDNGSVELSDAVVVFNYLFLGGPVPAAPFAGCGQDSTPTDALHCPTYPPCR